MSITTHHLQEQIHTHPLEFLRLLHIATYVTTGASAAMLTLVFPIITLGDSSGSGGLWSLLWAILLMSATTICVIGLLKKTWVGEYIGLLGVIVSYLVFALAGMSTAADMFSSSRVLVGSIILSLSTYYGGVIILCIVRFIEVSAIRKRQLNRGRGR